MNYADFGWATFPCNGKVPATPSGFKDADKTGAVFQKYKGDNIGVATGDVSGVWVLDIDVKKGAKGAESLAALVAKHGALPDTVKAKTWSGGLHYYFKMPAGGMGNRTNVFPGIDVRGSGGYVVAPPSTVDGKTYEWLNSPADYDPDPAPTWLLALLKEQKVAEPAQRGLITEGNRNAELTSRAGRLRSAGMDAGDIFLMLLKINATECSPPLPEKDVRVIAESVGRYMPANIKAPLTDLWNAERFAEKYGENLRWCPNLGWMLWDGVKWARRGKDDPVLTTLAMGFVKALTRQAEATDDKRLKTWAVKSESSGKLTAIVDLAKAVPKMVVDAGALDRDNVRLNCANGTLELMTGVLHEAKREDLMTKAVDVAYEAGAKCPNWLRFLDEIFQGDQSLVEYIQRAVGYCLSGLTTEQKFFICYGNGRNGKSTLLKHVMYMLGGTYAAATPAETMLESDGNTLHAIASLKGMRLVVLNEFDEGKMLSSAQVKTLTGGEPVVARHLYHEQFVYAPTYKFFMTTNHKPRIKDTSLGIWRRLVLLPFDYTVPPNKVDLQLDAKLAAEYPGVLAWAVQGFQRWAKDGLPALERLQREAACYQGQSDLIGQFLEESLDMEIVPEYAVTPVVDFMRALGAWCRENGVKHAPGRSAVIDYVARRGYGQPVRDNGAVARGKMVWRGLALVTGDTKGAPVGGGW